MCQAYCCVAIVGYQPLDKACGNDAIPDAANLALYGIIAYGMSTKQKLRKTTWTRICMTAMTVAVPFKVSKAYIHLSQLGLPCKRHLQQQLNSLTMLAMTLQLISCTLPAVQHNLPMKPKPGRLLLPFASLAVPLAEPAAEEYISIFCISRLYSVCGLPDSFTLAHHLAPEALRVLVSLRENVLRSP